MNALHATCHIRISCNSDIELVLNLPPMLNPTCVKFNQHTPPSMLWSHRNAVGVHCRNNSVVVIIHSIDVETMQNQST